MTQPAESNSSRGARVARGASAVLGQISEATDAFQSASGLACRPGCGQCCTKPGIEARVAELLPLAFALLAEGEADAAYEAAAAAPTSRCVFYAPTASDSTMGRCRVYAHRPSVCRLFGFAAVSGKDGQAPALAACAWMKRAIPEAVAKAQAAIEQGAPVPLYRTYSLQLSLLAPGPEATELLPINEALCRAIEKASLCQAEADVP